MDEHEAAEAARKWEEDDAALRSLRMGLRDIATRLLCSRQWKDFWEPIDPEDDPEYYARVRTMTLPDSCMCSGQLLCKLWFWVPDAS